METIVILNILLNHLPEMTLRDAYVLAGDISAAAGQSVAQAAKAGWTHQTLVEYCRARQDLWDMWNNGKKIQAIKEVRTKTNVGLKEAKEACEAAYGSF
jgi:ribosomal protein L7/L12